MENITAALEQPGRQNQSEETREESTLVIGMRDNGSLNVFGGRGEENGQSQCLAAKMDRKGCWIS